VGGVLLSVHCDTSEEITRAKDVLKHNGAQDISSAGEASADIPATTNAVIVLAVEVLENPAVPDHTLAKLFRQRRAPPSMRCAYAASRRATSILELRRHMPRPSQRICLAIRPWSNHKLSCSRMMLKKEQLLTDPLLERSF